MMSKEFEIARLLAVQECRITENNSLGFAWSSRIYPFFHDSPLQEAFIEDFDIGRESITAVLDYLEANENNPDKLGFYAIEDHFGGKNQGLERSKLRMICRYIFLCDRYTHVWEHVVRNGVGPVESQGIAGKFNQAWEVTVF
jgi:hypothetical protein